MKLLQHLVKSGLVLAALLLFSDFALAQRTIKGKVTDAESGEGLIGATVVAVGTTRGTSTDIDGNFSLEIPADATQIRFAYTGYAETVFTLTSSNVVEISLKPGSLLDEIVVIGYGGVKKSDLTGAVTSVTEKNFNGGVVVAPEQLIQGRAAGVQITNSNGGPGAGINVRIRGTSSIRSNNNPLFVVDGVPITADNSTGGGSGGNLGSSAARNPLNFLNPNDIASIDILKDASATAIYGSRGANGVVIITTKKGSAGKGTLDYTYSVAASQITKKYDLLGPQEYLAAYSTFNGAQAAQELNGGGQTDWQDEVLRTGITHNHNLSFGGSDKTGSYRFSVGYFDQEGIILRSGLTRSNARFNATKKFLNDRLTIATQITAAQVLDQNVMATDNSGFAGDLIANMLKSNPTNPVYKDGKLFQPVQSEPNPVAILELSRDYTSTIRALGNISAEIVLLEGLTFKTIVGFDRSISNRKSALSPSLNIQGIAGGRANFTDIINGDRLWENYFTYSKTLTSKVNMTAMVGYSYQQFNYEDKSFAMRNFRDYTDPDVMLNNLASVSPTVVDGANTFPSVIATNSSNRTDELQSYFGRLNFSIADKYLITATMRADGSTRFGANNKYGYFPSFAAKWRLSEEAFIPEVFSDLGLRAGYGVTGNQELGYLSHRQRQRFGDYTYPGDRNSGIDGGGVGAVAFENADLKWETTTQFNAGIDYGFLDGRISGSLDYYYKNTQDLLIRQRAAQPARADFNWLNIDADVINTGVELGINLVVVDNQKFRWDVLLNGAYNKNVVQNFKGVISTGRISGQGLSEAFAQRIAEGQPLYAFFVREFGGYEREGSATTYIGGDVQKFTGASPLPTLNGGLTNTFTLGNLDFSFFLNGVFGNYIYNNTANALFTAGALGSGRNVTPNVVGNGEAPTNAPEVSDRFLEKGDFVRLQDISLGYRIAPKKYISGIRIFANIQNLATFTNYSGQDPEVSTNKPIDDIPTAGIDYTAYPRARTFAVGVNVSF